MAFTTQQLITQLYVGYYNRAPDPEGLNYWIGRVNAGVSLADIADSFAASPEAIATYPFLSLPNVASAEVFVKSIYQNMFNRPADADGLAYYVGQLQSGATTPGQLIAEIQANANTNPNNTDGQVLANKVAVGLDWAAAAANTPAFTYNQTAANSANTILENVTADPATVTAAQTQTADFFNGPGAGTGQSYDLTINADTLTGTEGNDVFNANVAVVVDPATGNVNYVNTAQAIDSLTGGAGRDTFNVTASSAAAITLPTLSGIEVINAQSVAGLTIDTTATTGVENLNVTKAAGAVSATAGAATDLTVSMKAAGAAVQANGGKDVNVVLSEVASNANTISVGAGTAPAGAVNVSATGVASTNNTDVSLGTISVTGGTTVNVVQKATSSSAAIVADGTTETVTQGAVTVTAAAATTDVTVVQDKAVTAASTAAVAGVTEVANVKFGALESGQSATVGGLTFTAAKDLTAAEVAQAFANLSSGAITPTQIAPATTATGDTQGSGIVANGVFTGSLAEDWSSAAASGDTVVFTGKANTAMTNITASGTGTVAPVATTTTQGVTAVEAKNVLGVANGTVTINGEAALKAVTVDGYAASTAGAGINGGTNAALATVNLSNGASFDIDSAAETLALNLNAVAGTVTVAAGTKTINADVNGSTSTSTIASASAETLNVTGAGNVAGNTATGLTVATAINTTGMTGGNATFTIANGTTTSYAGGAGKDSVTVSNANVAITKAIDLGAGDDTLTLNVAAGVVAVPTATLKGGAGTNTIGLNAESAAALSLSTAFADKIEGFQKLLITDYVATARTVNLANMDGISYVVSNNAAASAPVPGNPQVYSFDIAGIELDDTGTLSAGGQVLFTATANDQDATAIIAGLTSTVTINGVTYDVAGSGGSNVTLTSQTNVAPQPAISVSVVPAGGTQPTNAGVTTTPGVETATGGVPLLTFDKMANDGTLELIAAGDGVIVKMADATGTADSFNIVTKVDGSNLGFGTVDVAGVETIKLSALDASVPPTAGASVNTGSLTLKADKATSLTIDGSSNVNLTLDATTKVLATIDASALTGALTASANGEVAMTITGGSGNDVLRASTGANAKADIINGGAGNDTIYAGANAAKLTGGDGNDLFILSAASATDGTKESNTYSEILDFSTGDLLQLQAFNGGTADVSSFAKLAATLNENTAVFSDFANAAILQASLGEAVYFNYKGDAYVVVDSDAESTSFVNGQDLIVKLMGINGDNLSFNSDYSTVALV